MIKLGIESKVRFLGNRRDVFELYQAMDVFVLPSFFEGIPVVGVEAQFSDLPCVFSDKTPKEVCFTQRVNFISLNAPIAMWAKKILEYKDCLRSSANENIRTSLYDINNAHGILEKYYDMMT